MTFDFLNSNGLKDGDIPKNVDCPFKDECEMKEFCKRLEYINLNFSCACARGFSLIKSRKKK